MYVNDVIIIPSLIITASTIRIMNLNRMSSLMRLEAMRGAMKHDDVIVINIVVI